ncbi:ABC transporter permease [Halopiger aswanensis]|uniref:ABC-2 type transport system permease protein n=1 Tax=Halopiger aswanensis TaxID=148449 RepID=A0A419W0G6_9EURY|nr:ABC transporter permease subunit [Halopiger aswanensis]RKD88977.1 ABC-2 type transport system permease protein [Halopiger aswanensis]
MSDVESATDEVRDGQRAPGSLRRIDRIVWREVRTLARTRTFHVLSVALAIVLVTVAVLGSASAGYVPTVVSLITPLELLVPVVAVAFGYRAIVADRERGELDVLVTYPISTRELVMGIYVGRAVGILVAITTPLLLVGASVAYLREEPPEIYATHAGADSPILFARFVVLTLVFALVVLAVALAISALSSATRSALALAIVGLVVLLVGLDLALVFGFATSIIPDGSLIDAIAISPLSAYRGLVFETVISTAAGTGPKSASPIASVGSLGIWTVGSLGVAMWAVNR